MKRLTQLLIGFVLVHTLFLWPVVSFAVESSEQQIARLKRQLEAAQSDLRTMAAQVKRLRDEKDELRKQLHVLRKVDDKWKGFRGLTWGQDIKTVKGMAFVEEVPPGRGKWYTRQGDQMTIGETKLSDIKYYFYRGKLASVWIYSKGIRNWWRLKDAAFARFGEGAEDEEDADTWCWGTRYTPELNCGDGTIILGYYPDSTVATLRLASASQEEKEAADDEAAAEKAKDDF